jgi:hypothetical protein
MSPDEAVSSYLAKPPRLLLMAYWQEGLLVGDERLLDGASALASRAAATGISPRTLAACRVFCRTWTTQQVEIADAAGISWHVIFNYLLCLSARSRALKENASGERREEYLRFAAVIDEMLASVVGRVGAGALNVADVGPDVAAWRRAHPEVFRDRLSRQARRRTRRDDGPLDSIGI